MTKRNYRPALVRMHLRDDGQPKAKLTGRQARNLAKKLGKRAYYCPVCGSHHIGGSR